MYSYRFLIGVALSLLVVGAISTIDLALAGSQPGRAFAQDGPQPLARLMGPELLDGGLDRAEGQLQFGGFNLQGGFQFGGGGLQGGFQFGGGGLQGGFQGGGLQGGLQGGGLQGGFNVPGIPGPRGWQVVAPPPPIILPPPPRPILIPIYPPYPYDPWTVDPGASPGQYQPQ